MTKRARIISCFLIFFLAVGESAIGQDSNALNNPPPAPAETSSKITIPISPLEYKLSIVVLAFGLFIILLEMFLIHKRKINSDNTIKFIVITLIIISTLFLITAGYSNDQIAPAVGLLGTIAGYLLGRIQSNANETHNQNPG